MIPRYTPTYSWSDMFVSLEKRFSENPQAQLCHSLAELYQRKHVFLFHRARVALYALLRAYDHLGGAVVVPAYNCIAVPEAILYAGYRPVFADVDADSVNMSAQGLEKALSSDSTAILITHQFGLPCDIDRMLEVCRGRGLLLIEDAAAALGARFSGRLVGTFADAAILSFQTTKVISGGVGGALLLDDDNLAKKVEHVCKGLSRPESTWLSLTRAMAWKVATRAWLYRNVNSGYRVLGKDQMFEVVRPHRAAPRRFLRECSRFSAALILNQLSRLGRNIERRSTLAQLYTAALSSNTAFKLPAIRPNCLPSWIQFPVIVSDRRAFFEHMHRHSIDPSWTFRYCCAQSYGLDGFPNSRGMALRVVGLPTYPSIPEEQARRICAAAHSYVPGDEGTTRQASAKPPLVNATTGTLAKGAGDSAGNCR